jgi:hypothetical protein
LQRTPPPAKRKRTTRHASARSAGQAVATAHVLQHAFGAAYYALKAVAAAEPATAGVRTAEERTWQLRSLPTHLRREVVSRIVIQKRGDGIFITVQKGTDF